MKKEEREKEMEKWIKQMNNTSGKKWHIYIWKHLLFTSKSIYCLKQSSYIHTVVQPKSKEKKMHFSPLLILVKRMHVSWRQSTFHPNTVFRSWCCSAMHLHILVVFTNSYLIEYIIRSSAIIIARGQWFYNGNTRMCHKLELSKCVLWFFLFSYLN